MDRCNNKRLLFIVASVKIGVLICSRQKKGTMIVKAYAWSVCNTQNNIPKYHVVRKLMKAAAIFH